MKRAIAVLLSLHVALFVPIALAAVIYDATEGTGAACSTDLDCVEKFGCVDHLCGDVVSQ